MSLVEQMGYFMSLIKKTFKRGRNAIRKVGSVTRKTLKRGTNLLGVTGRRRKARRSRRASRKSQ